SEGPTVTLGDQLNINKFAKANVKFKEESKVVELAKQELQNLEDAENDLMLLDDEDGLHPYLLGEVFVHLPAEEVTERLERKKLDLQQKCREHEERAASLRGEMAHLKKVLYDKFGDRINLDENPPAGAQRAG
ncbi:hypothetical protein BOX15_Mlig001609g2, partial [Macrostomum lignano]